MLGGSVGAGGAMYGVNETYPDAWAAAVAGVGVEAEGAIPGETGAAVATAGDRVASVPAGASSAARRWPELLLGRPEAGSAAFPGVSAGIAFSDCW
jgi:hypothetical protein